MQVTEAFASQHNITATAEGIGEYIFQLDDNPFQDNGYFLNVVARKLIPLPLKIFMDVVV